MTPTNPITHCFYARWFTQEEKRFLKHSSPDGCDEIYNLRTFAGRITGQLSHKVPLEYSDEDLKLINTLVKIEVGIGALLRGNVTIQGRGSRVDKSIEEALQGMEQDWSLA
jgi:hypothetical protein